MRHKKIEAHLAQNLAFVLRFGPCGCPTARVWGRVMRHDERVRHNGAQEEHVTGPMSGRPKTGKRNFKSEPWYSVAARQMSAARTTTNPELKDVPASLDG